MTLPFNPHINLVIADDHPDHIHIATSILSQLGCQIRIATNGLDAYHLIQQQKPTLALLDVSMPHMTGFELCKKIKSDPALSDIVVIFMTASNDEASITEGFACGAQDYVLKPYNPSELLARITTHLTLRLKTLELETAYHELNQFCHTVSHDLKAPALVLNQLTTLLKQDLGDTLTLETHEIMFRIHQKSSDLVLRLERLLELSRMNQKALKIEPVALNDLIEELLSELTSLESTRVFELTIDPLPVIYGDMTLLYFLFQNLLSNALKFTRPREIAKITLTYKETLSEHQIFITDNGVGFDTQYASKLFHVFERLHASSDFEGSGVGLSIVKKVMARHQGHITITSIQNQETIVTLSFPKQTFIS